MFAVYGVNCVTSFIVHRLWVCVRNMSQGVAGFFGIPNEDETEQQKRRNEWKERARRMHSSSVFLRGHKHSHDQPETVSAGDPSMVGPSCHEH